MSEETVTDGLLSPKDSILLILAESGGKLEVSNAELARRLDMDPSNLKRDLDGLVAEFLIRPLDGGGYELTGQGWQRLEPFTFVLTLLFGFVGALLAAIAVIGFSHDFLGVPVLRYGLESSAVSSALLLLWLYRRERANRSLLVRRKKRPARTQKQAVNLT